MKISISQSKQGVQAVAVVCGTIYSPRLVKSDSYTALPVLQHLPPGSSARLAISSEVTQKEQFSVLPVINKCVVTSDHVLLSDRYSSNRKRCAHNHYWQSICQEVTTVLRQTQNICHALVTTEHSALL